MSNRNTSEDDEIQKRSRVAAPSSPYEATVKHTCGSPILADRDHVNFHAVTLHDKLAKSVVRCAADFMTWRQNLHYNISCKKKLKTEDEYVPKYDNINLDLAVEKGTKDGEAFQALT